MMLKSFPITIATSHFYRAAYQATTGDKIAYAAFLAATTTVLGGVALQAKDTLLRSVNALTIMLFKFPLE